MADTVLLGRVYDLLCRIPLKQGTTLNGCAKCLCGAEIGEWDVEAQASITEHEPGCELQELREDIRRILGLPEEPPETLDSFEWIYRALRLG